jgi:hypothetical protein
MPETINVSHGLRCSLSCLCSLLCLGDLVGQLTDRRLQPQDVLHHGGKSHLSVAAGEGCLFGGLTSHFRRGVVPHLVEGVSGLVRQGWLLLGLVPATRCKILASAWTALTASMASTLAALTAAWAATLAACWTALAACSSAASVAALAARATTSY